jgi:diguanylate cyclase (GGDEF)-like protein
VLDSQPEAPFDKITSLVRTILNVPIATVSLIDQSRQWLKSRQGLDITETARDISFCTHTIRTREPMIIPNATLDSRFANNPLVLGPPFIRSYAGVPLCSPDGYNVGALCAIDTAPRQFAPEQIDVLATFAAVVVDELELRLIAHTDFLTGALTRRAFVAELDRVLARYARTSEPCAVISIDIDRFKSINDSFGHPVGDTVLAAVASVCLERTRTEDAFGRIGGEEFCLLLPGADTNQAHQAAERLRLAIEALTFMSHPSIRVTASFGVAPITPDETANTWLARADAALYVAKQSGRNRSCVAT